MIRGISEVSQNLKLCTVMPLAEVLKTLSKAIPRAVLKLLFGSKEFDFVEQMVHHLHYLDLIWDSHTGDRKRKKIFHRKLIDRDIGE